MTREEVLDIVNRINNDLSHMRQKVKVLKEKGLRYKTQREATSRLIGKRLKRLCAFLIKNGYVGP